LLRDRHLDRGRGLRLLRLPRVRRGGSGVLFRGLRSCPHRDCGPGVASASCTIRTTHRGGTGETCCADPPERAAARRGEVKGRAVRIVDRVSLDMRTRRSCVHPQRLSLLALTPATALLLAGVTAQAAGWPDERDRALPCRPTIACTAELVPPGTFE